MDAKQSKPAEAFKITGNWTMLSKRLKEKFSKLTDADLKFEAGKENDLLRRIETRLHKKREEVIQLIKAAEPGKSLAL